MIECLIATNQGNLIMGQEIVQIIGMVCGTTFLVFLFCGDGIISAIRNSRRQRHIEKLVECMPEKDRAAFIITYLNDPKRLDR